MSITLSLNQIIRSGIPVFTALLGVVVEKKVPARLEILGIVVLTAGVVTCLYEGSSLDGSMQGIMLCLSSTLCGAGMLSFSGAALDRTEKMDPVRLNFYSAPVSIAVRPPLVTLALLTRPSLSCNSMWHCPCCCEACTVLRNALPPESGTGCSATRLATESMRGSFAGQVLAPAFLALEAAPLADWWATHTHEVALYIMAGGVLAVMYNIVHSLMIQRTSAVSTPVIGMLKVIAIVILSAIFLGERDVLTVSSAPPVMSPASKAVSVLPAGRICRFW